MNKIQIWLKSKLISLILIAIIIAQLLLSTGCSRLETGAVWVRELLVVEAGAESISSDQFVSNAPDDVTPLFVGSLDHIYLNTPGDYELKIALGAKVYDCILRVVAADDPRLSDPELNSQDASYAKSHDTTERGSHTTLSYRRKSGAFAGRVRV
jgi:hypothetical protein